MRESSCAEHTPGRNPVLGVGEGGDQAAELPSLVPETGHFERRQLSQETEVDMDSSPKRMTRRHFLTAAGGLAGAAALAACAPVATPQVVEKIVEQTVVVEKEVVITPTVGPPVTIVAHFTFSPTYKPRIEGWTEAFKQRYASINVELIFEPWGEWQTKIITLAAAGQTTELLAVHFQRAQVLAQMGALLPLDDWIAADPDFDL
mgnify:CR=1 FL=1